ncbi:Neural Wiskott-Aldrich syndrome protein [Holothuria leucospilota]|uniref:Neural Wiskott-Aldrich syndrome protein n=1 Tax=Holothuria leucospilota TaxID=206669 RepID=A0A9Q1CLJ4_HOLLE|nr:Neural Wiskott-Aldrich syndrome protein [Holothuria leucospilota]
MDSNNAKKPKPNVRSMLLNKAENEKLFSLLEYRSQSLSSTVVQVFTFDTDKKWTKLCCGVACFVKDYRQRSHFIRVYDIMIGARIYEHELYNNFEYNKRTSFFHDFAGEDSWIGLNFANDDEAEKFNEAIQSFLLQKKEKRLQKRQTKRKAPPSPMAQQKQVPPPPVASIPAPSAVEKDKSSKKGKDKKDKAKKRFSKSDITGPSNFIHLSHVGYGDEKQSGLNDKELREWLEQIGMSDKVQTSAQLDFIRQWVHDHGGRDAVEKDKERVKRASTKRGPPPPVPSSQSRGNRGTPPVPPTPPTATVQPPAAPPPPPPNRRPPSWSSSTYGNQVVRSDSRRAQPPPPPIQPPLPPQSSAPPPPPPPPPVSGVPPPPPPPPPPATGGPPPPPPPPPPSMTEQNDHPPPPPSAPNGRGGLLSEIQSGIALRPASQVNNVEKRESTGRDDLLEQIRGGITLKKVEDRDSDGESTTSFSDLGTMGAALRQALEKRDLAMRGDSDEETDSEEYDSDDWDD